MGYISLRAGGKIVKYHCKASNCDETFTTKRDYKDHLYQIHAQD